MKSRFYFFLSVGAYVLIGTGCSNAEIAAPATDPVKVEIQEIAATKIQSELSYSGYLEAENTATVGFAVPGTVSNINVQEGEYVKRGQLLAVIDDTEYKNALAIADAGLEQAEDMYRRLNSLYEKGSLPAKDYIDIKTKVAQAKANKTISQKRISDSRLYSPIDGIISSRKVENGSTAAPGLPAFTIVKTDMVYAKFSVPEIEIGKLTKGILATVFLPTLNKSYTGKVAIINPQSDEVSKTYTVKVKLPNPTLELLPGMLVKVALQNDGEREAITIPAAAVVRDADDITYVYVAGNDSTATRKRISTSGITGQNRVIVSEGIQPGEKIITAGQTRLSDGAAIRF